MGVGNWVNLSYVQAKVPVLGREEGNLGRIFEGYRVGNVGGI